MIKIIVDKKEDIASVIEKVLMSRAADITLVIPKNARIGESVANFHLLKREAEAADKHLAIESIDDDILASAKASRIEGSHPLFREKARHSFSDIVQDSGKHGRTVRTGRAKEEEEKLDKEVALFAPAFRKEEDRSGFQNNNIPIPPARPRPVFNRKIRIFLVAATLLILGGMGLWEFETALGRVDINISLVKRPFSYGGAFTADKAVSKIDLISKVIPGELFVMSKNTVQLFQASGKEMVNEKAKGTITIFNAYDSNPQLLVAMTRFVTPDGKIFRLDQKITIPGARIQNGKITPSSVEVPITADKPGVEYNIGPVPKLSIPGFKDSPRYQGFYAMLREPTRGGLIGEASVPTDQDIRAAKEKTLELLKVAIAGSTNRTIPPEFKILDGASKFQIVKITTNTIADADGKFSVFGEAKQSAIGFREEDIGRVLSALGAQNSSSALVVKDLDIKYSNPVPDFERGQIVFDINAKGVLAPPFDINNLKGKIRGQTIEEVRENLILLKNQIKFARISVWPWWLKSVPLDAGRIHVTAQ